MVEITCAPSLNIISFVVRSAAVEVAQAHLDEYLKALSIRVVTSGHLKATLLGDDAEDEEEMVDDDDDDDDEEEEEADQEEAWPDLPPAMPEPPKAKAVDWLHKMWAEEEGPDGQAVWRNKNTGETRTEKPKGF